MTKECKDKKTKKKNTVASMFWKSRDPRKEPKTVIRAALILSEWLALADTAEMVKKSCL